MTNKSRDDVQCSIDIGIPGMFTCRVMFYSVNFISILSLLVELLGVFDIYNLL